MMRASKARLIRASAARLAIVAIACALNSAAGAQGVVGRLPTQSVLRDLPDGHRFGLFAGWLTTNRDPVGVGGHSAPIFGARYDLLMGSPAYFSMRAFAIKSEHDVMNPNAPVAERKVGTASSNQLAFDASIHVSLTGARSWHGVQPLAHLGLGVITGLANDFDAGNYKPGTSAIYSYGLAARFPTGRNGEFRADLGWLVYQVRYPSAFRTTTAVDNEPLRASDSLNPLTTNRAITLSWTWGVFR